MQSNHRYQNMFRAIELAISTHTPFVLYDKDELGMLTLDVAINHLPVDKGGCAGYVARETCVIKELEPDDKTAITYHTFVNKVNDYGETVGLKVTPDRKAFTIFVKR